MRSHALSFIVIALLVVSVLGHATTGSGHKGRQWKPSKYAADRHTPAPIQSYSDVDPQQVHITLDNVNNGMVVTWLTWSNTKNNILQFSLSPNNYVWTSPATSTLFVDPGSLHRERYIHDARTGPLNTSTTYYYRVGDGTHWSPQYSFTTLTNDERIISVAVFGDMGVVNSQSMDNLKKELQSKQIQIVLHVGDYAYDLHTNNGTVGDVFMNQMQDIAANAPYLGCAGNHEGKWNFSHYVNRFSGFQYMNGEQGTGTPLYFSWDYVSGGAKVHYVALNSEFYFIYVDETTPPDYALQRQLQYEWLEQDLKNARLNKVDWIIVYAHRPMYCSNTDDLTGCTSDAATLRKGFNMSEYGWEEIITRYNVDLYISGHEHSYERTYPVLKGTIDPQSNHTYVNPKYPVHIITGSAGCEEYFDTFDEVFYGPWSVIRSATYGYGHLVVHNSTHLYWDQLINESFEDKDELWIVRQ